MTIEPDEWLAGKALSQAKLRDEGIIVLSIRRTDGSFIGAPRGYTQIEAGDNIVVYGREPSVKRLVARRTGSSGDVEHQQAVIEQRQILSNINQEPT
jgi:Trk K+ transport system NAD-binding subunit